MSEAAVRIAPRPRSFVAVTGADAGDLLQRLLSNDVLALEPGEACEALLLTPKARVVAPATVLRRGQEDFLLLTEPGLSPVLARAILRARFAARCDVAEEEHRSTLVFGGAGDGIAVDGWGERAVEVLDRDVDGEVIGEEELERMRIRAALPAWGRELDDRVLPAEAGLVPRAVSLSKGCYPGQEPIARLHYRGHANRGLRVLALEAAEPPPYDAEVRHRDRVVGRVTSAVPDGDGRVLALGYVRLDVPEDAELSVEGALARILAPVAA